MPTDPSPKPQHWTDEQEQAYQAILAQEAAAAAPPATRPPTLLPPPAAQPNAVASPDGKWLWDGQNWVPAPHRGLTVGQLLAVIALVAIVAVVIWAVVSENSRQDDMNDRLQQINCQNDPESC